MEDGNDRPGHDMEKVYTNRQSSVNEETEQDNSELAGGQTVNAHLWEQRTGEAAEFNLKERPPSR